MNKVKFKLNREGVRDLLTGSEMQSVLTEYAGQVATRAGSGYAYAIRPYPERLHANIYPDSPEAAHDNYENNTLLKALGGK